MSRCIASSIHVLLLLLLCKLGHGTGSIMRKDSSLNAVPLFLSLRPAHLWLPAVTKRLSSESSDAKRAGDEAGNLKREVAQLQGELNRSRQEVYEAKERLRQLQADGERHTAQVEGQAAEMSQQLVVSGEGGT
jgi:uncharacterized protein YlxW (UPF0749 family)